MELVTYGFCGVELHHQEFHYSMKWPLNYSVTPPYDKCLLNTLAVISQLIVHMCLIYTISY